MHRRPDSRLGRPIGIDQQVNGVSICVASLSGSASPATIMVSTDSSSVLLSQGLKYRRRQSRVGNLVFSDLSGSEAFARQYLSGWNKVKRCTVA